MWSQKYCFFNDTATTEIYTLSLHDALPISMADATTDAFGSIDVLVNNAAMYVNIGRKKPFEEISVDEWEDRKSTRLNSSHANISYAVFCLKKKTIPMECRS